MEIDIRENQKIVGIWLSKGERDGPELRDTLRNICAEYGLRKYTVAVFKSGEEDLCDLTSGLLITNRRKLAERQAASERMAAPSMTMGM